MHNPLRTRLLMTTAAITILTAPVLATATPAFASGGGGGVTASGACTNGGHFKLKAKHEDNGKIELEYQVDSNRAGQRWAVRITDNGTVVVSRHATTAGPSGSFTIRKTIANKPGQDKIHARATFKNRTCTGTVKL